MKLTFLVLTTSFALVSSPMMAEDTVKLTTTKSTQASLGLGAGGAIAGLIALAVIVGIAANSGSSGGT